MEVTLSGIVMLLRLEQPLKASAPMEEMPSGIATLVRLVQSLKASAPMEVTVLLSMVAGISTSHPEPLYFVMVTVLPLTV